MTQVRTLLGGLAVVLLASAVASAQGLKHRYSFESDASDSIGGADGVVVDDFDPTAVFADGQLDLSANTGEGSAAIEEDAYVDLPNGVVTDAVNSGTEGAVSFEWWATVDEIRTWSRFGDFGTSNNGEDTSDSGNASSYVLITPNSGRYANGLEMTNHPASNAAEPNVGVPGPFPVGVEQHVLAVYDHTDTTDGDNGSMRLYLNGALQGSNQIHADIDMRTMVDDNNWLGRSQWNDPTLVGKFNEFRIYDVALDDTDAIVSAVGGPDSIPEAGVPAKVGGPGELKSFTLDGQTTNLVFSEPSGPLGPGLGQSWYAVGNPGSKAGVDNIAFSNERLVPYFRAEDGTWWTGSGDLSDIHKYPVETDVPGQFEGANRDNYTVVLTGEILIEEDTIRFLDGVDDFTYLAIDIDNSGTAGDDPNEVLINDNAWTNANSSGNGGAPIVQADFPNKGWLAMEFAMAEGGGGDHGMLYWDALDEDEVFPENQGDGVDDLDAFFLQIPDTHLQSHEVPSELISGDFVGSLPAIPQGWEIDVNADGTSDVFALAANPDDDVYTSILDVDGVVFHVNATGEFSEGDTVKILDAEQITGTATVATVGWSFDAATGSLVFGDVVGPCDPNTQGDLDGNGIVEFGDFLILSGNFGSNTGNPDHTIGDIDCDGDVDFTDFLALSGNFGNTVGGAEAVPEPNGFAIASLAILLLARLRRRR